MAATSAQINGSILSNTLSNNIGPGISMTANTGTINLTEIDSNTLDGNTTGVALSTLNSGTIATRVTNNTMNNSTGDAFTATADTGVITLNQFSDNTLDNAGGNGIVLTALNGGTITITNSEDGNGNSTLDAGEDVNSNGLLDLGMFNNSLNNPTGNGLFVTGTNGTFNLGTISGMSIDRSTSGTGGIVIDVTDSTTTGSFLGNTLTSAAGNANRGPGFSLTATNGTFDVTVGGPNASDRNLIQNNRGAGIVILAQNTAVGTFDINNNLITGTVDDADVTTPFSGQGIYVGTRTSGSLIPATATLNNGTIQNNVIGDASNRTLGNAGGGILVDVGQEANLIGLTIDSNVIGSNGPAAPAVFAANVNNVVNGVTFLRNGDAVIDNASITNNQFTNNTSDGIYLHALGGSADTLDFTIQGNTISNSAFDGIRLLTEGDAQLDTTITENQITNNGLNGISTNSRVLSVTDTQAQTGVWTKNTISNNGGRGIFLNSTTLTSLVIGQLGTDPVDGLSLGNVIASNGMSGVEVDAIGNLELNNNTIQQNGAAATALGVTDANGLGGIDFNPTLAGTLQTRLINNIIVSNTGNGIESIASTGQTSSFTMLGNLIDGNTGRGIDLLTRADGRTNALIGDGTLTGGNTISNNGLEGIYIVNTSSATQAQAGNALVADGTVNTVPPLDPFTLLDIRGNSIVGNNNSGTFQAGGLVLRAGSSDAFGNGQLTGRVSGNTFSGNQGLDFLAQTFASTVVPAAAPLPPARLNLVFGLNTGNTMDPNQNGSFYGVVDTSQMNVEAGFDTTGFGNGGVGQPGAFSVPNPWTVVPAGTISNNINVFVFP
ncbi:MAG: Polymorphic membrane protein [Planctomycetota bacterium]|nr:MAG: Polymorphic membrane protein [Planctomycetota bacterium]